MHFTFTPTAAEQLAGYLKDGERSLKLLYDTEGCGCAVNGVPALQLVAAPVEGDTQGTGDPYNVWYEPRIEVFFDPELKIDFDRSRNAFSLKSDGQIYTVNMRLLA